MGDTFTQSQILSELARGKHLATWYREEQKKRNKQEPCENMGYDFIPMAVSTAGGMGECLEEWFHKTIERKLAAAKTRAESYRVEVERRQFLIRLSVLCARRNHACFQQLAHPKGGGRPPAPPRVEYEE